MKNVTTDEKLSEEIINAFKAIAVNSLFNCYALENVALSLINPNEHIPIEQYVTDLQIRALSPYARKEYVNGIYIDENLKIIGDKDELTIDFYSSCINTLFDKIMKRKYAQESFYDLSCSKHYRDYFIESYSLFKDIIDTEIEYDNYDIIPDNLNRHEQSIHVAKMTKFVVAILLNGLQRRKCVDRYLKDIDALPFAVKNLIEKVNNRFILVKPTDSVEYKIALFYLFPYLTETHRKIFELKAERWYELNVVNLNRVDFDSIKKKPKPRSSI